MICYLVTWLILLTHAQLNPFYYPFYPDITCVRKDIVYTLYKKCVHVPKFVVPSAMVALAVSLSENCDESEEERARRLTRKWKQRQRDKR